ncbi:MAG: hypothetical protein AAF723_03825 [Pseudomonadota bacterium]
MAAVVIRRLQEEDKIYLKKAAKQHGLSMEAYVRQLILQDKQKHSAASAVFGDALKEMNADLTIEDKTLLEDIRLKPLDINPRPLFPSHHSDQEQ